MKSAKKILALILAGVMALALLTGCGKATSLDRTIAEGLAEYLKLELAEENNNNISVSYQVPELSRDIAPLFDKNWIMLDGTNYRLNEDCKINGEPIKEALADILRPYKSTSIVFFSAADVTDVKTPFMETSNLTEWMINLDIFDGTPNPTSITSLKIAVTHKTVNGRTYALAMIIAE